MLRTIYARSRSIMSIQTIQRRKRKCSFIAREPRGPFQREGKRFPCLTGKLVSQFSYPDQWEQLLGCWWARRGPCLQASDPQRTGQGECFRGRLPPDRIHTAK